MVKSTGTIPQGGVSQPEGGDPYSGSQLTSERSQDY